MAHDSAIGTHQAKSGVPWPLCCSYMQSERGDCPTFHFFFLSCHLSLSGHGDLSNLMISFDVYMFFLLLSISILLSIW